MRQMLLDMLTDNDELANMDERLAAMIAQIVEAYGRYNSSRGPSYSSYQALKAMNLDDLEGRLLACSARPYGDEPTPTQEQIAKAIAAQRIAQLRKMVEGETKRARPSSWAATTCRCTAFRSWPRTSSSCAPPASNCVRCCRVVHRWPAHWRRGLPPGGAGRARGDRSAQDAAQVDVHRGCRSMWC